MSNLSKNIIIFIAAVLLFTGISKDYNSGLLTTTNNNSNAEHSFIYSLENVNSLYFLQREGDNFINFANNLPFPNLKLFSNLSASNSFAFELGMVNRIHQYCAFSKIIHQSLPIQLIIFPFHLFG